MSFKKCLFSKTRRQLCDTDLRVLVQRPREVVRLITDLQLVARNALQRSRKSVRMGMLGVRVWQSRAVK